MCRTLGLFAKTTLCAVILAVSTHVRADDTWWSFRPLDRPAVPATDSSWAETPIDAFLLAKLHEKALAPSPQADRRTLIRRLTFDLHGLPPTPEEVAAFVADPAPDAYEKLVDRLLASPRYGERWGRHWLDVAHYADTHGYDKDKRRENAWPYRDYVIRALNTDKPYARFVKEQLAGDVLWPHDPDAIVATGFIAAGPWDFVGHVELREGTVDKKKTRLIDRDDMVSTTMSTFVSLTAHCARCHAHKFDPISQEEYYRLQAVFAGVDRGDRPYELPTAASRRRALHAEEKRLAAAFKTREAELHVSPNDELTALDARIARLRKEVPEANGPLEKATSPSNGYHSAIAAKPETTKWVQVDLGRTVPASAIRLVPARPTDFPDAPGFGFPVRFRVETSQRADFAQPVVVADAAHEAFRNLGDVALTIPLPARPVRTVRVTATHLWKRTNDYVFALAELEVYADGRNVARGATVTAADSIEAGRWGKARLVDGFSSRRPSPETSDATARNACEVALIEAQKKRAALAASLVDPQDRAAVDRARAALDRVRQRIAALPKPRSVYAVKSRGPRPIHVLARGDVELPGELVGAGALRLVRDTPSAFALDRPDDEGRRRAALAGWLTHPANPLPWRSIVNRVWQYHFGRGLVDTPNDFGRNGAHPTHPALLDWLAVEFRDHGGSFKRLHRLIVCSAAYRQVSHHRADAAAIDAGNRLLWRMNRRRLDAEEIRDAALAVTGRLDLRMGGPGFQPFGFEDDHSPRYKYEEADPDDPTLARRTIYQFIVRSVPDPYLTALDCADPSISTPMRTPTLTALHAFALLNTPFMVQQASHLAERVTRAASTREAQIRSAIELTFGRRPTGREIRELAAYAKGHGLPNMCRVLINASEFVFVD